MPATAKVGLDTNRRSRTPVSCRSGDVCTEVVICLVHTSSVYSSGCAYRTQLNCLIWLYYGMCSILATGSATEGASCAVAAAQPVSLLNTGKCCCHLQNSLLSHTAMLRGICATLTLHWHSAWLVWIYRPATARIQCRRGTMSTLKHGQGRSDILRTG